MGKIVYLMGKSSSGKDTIFKELMKEGTMDLRTIVPYTTRPIRAGEENGVEYFFTDEAGFQALKDQGKVIDRIFVPCLRVGDDSGKGCFASGARCGRNRHKKRKFFMYF